MILLLWIVIIVAFGFGWLVYQKLKKEHDRNRILQAFIAGIIRTISDYRNLTDSKDQDEFPDKAIAFPIPYSILLENIDYELSKDQLLAEYEKWITNDANRKLFFDDKNHTGDGFTFMYYDLFDKKYREWSSDELMPPKIRRWLSEEIVVTRENIGELGGEIAMLKDLMRGDLDSTGFTRDNIDDKLYVMFSHIRYDMLQTAKNIILSKNAKEAQ